ncbi:MAG: hypothetical protein PVI90_10615, partial [Desulfobacteraceae bacterium]
MRLTPNVFQKAIHILYVLSFILAGMILAASPSRADSTYARVLFILDGSGSMWGRLDNTPKIVIAKEQLTKL